MKLKFKLPSKNKQVQTVKKAEVVTAVEKSAESIAASASDDAVYLYVDGKQQGPFTKDDIIQKYQNDEISADTMIQYGTNPWMNPTDVSWLSEAGEQTQQDDLLNNTSDVSYNDTPLVSCPHCWHKFHINDILYISKAPDLLGDPVLGENAQMRFVPSSFNEMGYAIDANGYVCPEMACPRCHLKIPESFFNLPTNIFSVVGAPSSGKSYFLTAMIWMLRNVLPKKFNCTLTDPDTTFNLVLNSYERTLYLNQNAGALVSLPKTELQGGDFSNQIMLNGISVDLPLPYIFSLVPTPANTIMESQRNIIFYDNAGEHFEPGRDNIANLATQHLALSECIIYVYDPIKDPRMSINCDPNDPQVARRLQGTSQIVLINEMIARIRKYTGLKSTEKYDKPLIVVMHKYDAWKSVFPIELSDLEYSSYDQDEMCWQVSVGNIKLVSYLMREILLDLSPDIVAVTESFFKEVYFLPVSSLGHIPEIDPAQDSVSVRAGSLNPIWAEVPVLMALVKAGLVPVDESVKVSQSDTVIEIEKFKYRNGSVIFTMPGLLEPVMVPEAYFGHVVYSMKAGCFIRIPMPEATPESAAQAPVKKTETDSFWES